MIILFDTVFLKKWKEQPFLWLLHHGDTKDEKYDYNAVSGTFRTQHFSLFLAFCMVYYYLYFIF